MNFVIYEDLKEYANKYKTIIHKLLASTNMHYKTVEINEYNNKTKEQLEKIEGNKIYILDIEVPGKSGLDLARKIRNNGDWSSPIIIITSHEEFKNVGYTAKLLMLNFIVKNEELETDLIETLKIALEINMSKKNLCYTNKGELFQIPYQDILYIEKGLKDNICYVITINDEFTIRKTIIELEQKLADDMNFVKTHRSCIVNIKNIKYVDFENNRIHFINKSTDLLSRAHRKNLKEKLGVK